MRSMRHAFGIGLLGSFGGDTRKGRGLCFLEGGGVARLSCVGCVGRFLKCMNVFVGEVGLWAGKVWLCSGIRLYVGWSFGFVGVCVWCVLLVWVSEACVRRGGFRRPPALKTSVVVGKCFGGVA
jgi:hypothetical protein